MAPPEADPREWLRKAREDLRVAELVIAAKDVSPGPAGFHLQQAAEKALKAILVARGKAAPRTHDLQQLGDAVEALEPTFSGWAERVLPLDDFSVAQRYPGVTEPEIDLAALKKEVELLIDAAERACGPGRP